MHWCVQSWKVGAKAPPENLCQPQIHLHLTDFIRVQFFSSRQDYMYVKGFANRQHRFTLGNLKRETKCFLTFSAALNTCDRKVGRNHSQAPFGKISMLCQEFLIKRVSLLNIDDAPSPTFKKFDIDTRLRLESGLQERRNFKKINFNFNFKLKNL